jgi:glyoxylase-like metal-dependent hydrolase (beta-lactamase superfamily II)
MIQKIKSNVWQFTFTQFGSNVYFIKLNRKNILIDTSSAVNRDELQNCLNKLKITKINIIILTHKHWDHTENIHLFPNAKIYASKKDFKDKKILDIDDLNFPEFKIIKTPGHSEGSFCILYKNILFSGDTIFHNGAIGRMDLPGGSEQDMKNSLEKLQKVNFKILCPGH